MVDQHTTAKVDSENGWRARQEISLCRGGYTPVTVIADQRANFDHLRDDFASSSGDIKGTARIQVSDALRWPNGKLICTIGRRSTSGGVVCSQAAHQSRASAIECLHTYLWFGK